ncbi:MAG: UvrD-helicase domain-containing protein [Nitrospiria bacterium]
MKQLESNNLVIASAGSGKTTFLVEEALSRPDKKIVILTYTNNNISEIKKKFCEKHGGIPKEVDVMTWFFFLLRECTRPYQRSVYSKSRVRTIFFSEGRSVKGAPYSKTERYYFRNGDEIYSDKISRFVIDCETNSNGLMTKRLADIYDEIFIDEFQDLAGYDLDLLELFLKSGIRMVIVGDPRQCTYTTNSSAKNSQYRGVGIHDLVYKWKASNLCQIVTHARNYRCNQKICDFASALFPKMENMESLNSTTTDHDGIFVVSEDKVHNYVNRYNPAVLRYNRNANTYGYPALNFGNAKGLEFGRVLIIPHGPIKKYLQKGEVKDVEKSLEKFYVAVTRAKHSVAFLHDGKCSVGCIEWQPTADS